MDIEIAPFHVVERAKEIAKVIGAEPDTITVNSTGVVLAPEQVDLLFVMLTGEGFLNAIKTLRESADTANDNNNLTLWAVYQASASFLEGLVGITGTGEMMTSTVDAVAAAAQVVAGLQNGPTCRNCGKENHKAWERCPLAV